MNDLTPCARRGCSNQAKPRGKFCSDACRAAYHNAKRKTVGGEQIGTGKVRGCPLCNGGWLLMIHMDSPPQVEIGDEITVYTRINARTGKN